MHDVILRAIAHVNLADIGDVQLVRLIRDALNDPVASPVANRMNLSQALLVAKALKESYRLGVIRGGAVRS